LRLSATFTFFRRRVSSPRSRIFFQLFEPPDVTPVPAPTDDPQRLVLSGQRLYPPRGCRVTLPFALIFDLYVVLRSRCTFWLCYGLALFPDTLLSSFHLLCVLSSFGSGLVYSLSAPSFSARLFSRTRPLFRFLEPFSFPTSSPPG